MINLLHLISDLTYDFIPYIVGLNFILLIILIFLNRKILKSLFLESFDKKTLVYFLLILLLSTLIRFVPKDLHYHRMWLDDFYYMEAAKSIAENNFSDIRYFKYIGWPFILSIFFALFSVNNWVALYASSFFGVITTINIFLITFLITENKKISLLSSLIFSLLPYHIIWSCTAETNVVSLFFVTLSIVFYLMFYRYKNPKIFWLSCISTAFNMQFRPENYSLPLLFLIGVIIFHRDFLKKINLKYLLIIILIFSLTIPDFVNWMRGFLTTNVIENDSRGKMNGDNWSISNLLSNSKKYAPYFIKNVFQPYLFSFFLLLGLVTFYFKMKKSWFFLLSWFFILYLIYFTSWLQTLGGKPRLFIMFSPITSIFVSFGIFSFDSRLKKTFKINNSKDDLFLLIITFFLIVLIFFTKNKIESNFNIGASLEAKVIEKSEKDIPNGCTLVRTIPLISTSTSDIKSISINQFLEIDSPNLEFNCFLFLEDFPCFNDFMYEDNVKTRLLCENLKKSYKLSEVKQYNMENVKYTLYKIEIKI